MGDEEPSCGEYPPKRSQQLHKKNNDNNRDILKRPGNGTKIFFRRKQVCLRLGGSNVTVHGLCTLNVISTTRVKHSNAVLSQTNAMIDEDAPPRVTRCATKVFGGMSETSTSRDALNAHLVERSHGAGRLTTTRMHRTSHNEDRGLTDVAGEKSEDTENRRNERKEADWKLVKNGR